MQGFLSYRPVMVDLASTASSPLAIDVAEPTEDRIRRLVSENPVIVFSRTACCMAHVMRRLLIAVGAQPTVIEVGEDEINFALPALYVGGCCVGGLESMVALHLSNSLVPKLIEAGALKEGKH